MQRRQQGIASMRGEIQHEKVKQQIQKQKMNRKIIQYDEEMMFYRIRAREGNSDSHTDLVVVQTLDTSAVEGDSDIIESEDAIKEAFRSHQKRQDSQKVQQKLPSNLIMNRIKQDTINLIRLKSNFGIKTKQEVQGGDRALSVNNTYIQ